MFVRKYEYRWNSNSCPQQPETHTSFEVAAILHCRTGVGPHFLRPGAPGGHTGAVPPPNDCLCPPKRKLSPPKRGLCPEEINRLGATGVQIEVQIGVYHRYFRSFCGLTPDFMTFLGWRPLFFGDHPFSAGKIAWIPDFGRKIPLNLCSSPCLFDPDWDKFLVLPCPSRIHINKNFSCPPKIYFCPPSHAILAPGLHCHQSSVLKQTF